MKEVPNKFKLCIANNKQCFIRDIRDWKTQRKGKYTIKTNDPEIGTEVWLVKGLLHRDDGPALIIPLLDRKHWYLNGDKYTKEKWIDETRKLKLQKLGV